MQQKWLLVLVVAAVIVGCSRSESPPPERKVPARSLLIGLIPEQHIFRQIERYEPLADYLQARTGYGIRLTVLPRYGNAVDNFKALGLDGAFFGSFTYVMAHARLGVVVLARPENSAGQSTYHGVIVARKDSGIRTAAQLRGKRFAFVDTATTAGYLLPLDYFRRNGVGDYRKYFRETWFAGTHEDVIYDVLERRADAGAAKSTVFDRLAASDRRISRDLGILARSPEVPENALAVRGDIEEPVRMALKDALLGMDEDPEGREVLARFGARRFIETGEDDYRPVFDYVRALSLDLSRYGGGNGS